MQVVDRRYARAKRRKSAEAKQFLQKLFRKAFGRRRGDELLRIALG